MLRSRLPEVRQGGGLVWGIRGVCVSRRMELLNVVDIGRYLFAQMILLDRCQQTEYPDDHLVHRIVIGFEGLLFLCRSRGLRGIDPLRERGGDLLFTRTAVQQ